MTITIAIGDIHGMADMLARLLSHVEAWLGKKPAQFVFLGDYVDRGPDSRKVVESLRIMQQGGAICLCGNHEQLMMLSTRSLADEQNFLFNGGASTRESFGSGAAFAGAQDWMRSLPISYEDALRYYVHAGIDPFTQLALQDDDTRLWIRDKFLEYPGPFPKYIVHGHTPTTRYDMDRTAPDIRSNRCCVDTGAGSGGPLSAAIFDGVQAPPIHTITTY